MVVASPSTFTNAGQVPYYRDHDQPSVTDVLDDATCNGDQTATSGTLSLSADRDCLDRGHPGRRHRHHHRHVTVNNPVTGDKC